MGQVTTQQGQLTAQQWLEQIKTGITKQLSDHQKALPNGFQKERFALNCVTMIQDMMRDSKKRDSLSKVNSATIPLCFMKGAMLGLDFYNGECYAIPYGNEMKFQTDYKGEIKLCKKYSKNPIRDIYAKVVREGDEFYEEVNGGDQNIYFRPQPFNNGKLIGAFAVVKYKDGSMMYETMSAEEIEGIRTSFSKAANSAAWRNTPGEMYKKTVLRRLCKLVDMDFDNVEQMKAYEDGGDADFTQPAVEERAVNVFEVPKNQAAISQKPESAQGHVQTVQRKKDPEPVRVNQEPIDEYARYEAEYDIPIDDSEMPFK